MRGAPGPRGRRCIGPGLGQARCPGAGGQESAEAACERTKRCQALAGGAGLAPVGTGSDRYFRYLGAFKETRLQIFFFFNFFWGGVVV